MQSADHLGLLVDGIFNASISADILKRQFKYDHDECAWLYETGQIIKDGDSIEFNVTAICVENEFISISGSI